MLRFTDPLSHSSGSLSKVKYFLDFLSLKFQTNYIPGEYVAVDEFLSKWKGRLHFKQYIPSKRDRYGVKTYMLCESSSAYLWKFIIYTGADTFYPQPNCILLKPFDHYGNPSKIVLSLMDGLYGKGYKVVLDNFYTSPELLRTIICNETDSFGTLRHKKGLPTDFRNWKPCKEVGSAPMRKFCNNLMVCRWTDCYKKTKTKIVSLMSTKHTGDLVATGKTHYSSKLKIFKPDVIVEYNQTMGGVDNLSRNLDPYSCQRKTLKWYRKLAELFIDISIYNSYVIWKELTTSHATHLSFRQVLVRDIITAHHYGATKNQRGRKIHEH